MSLISPRKIDELVLAALTAGPSKTTTLFSEVCESHLVSKQGFYAALRRLRANDTIVVAKRQVSLNTTWIHKMRDLVAKMGRTYEQREEHEVLRLRDKESISYIFSSLRQLDNFWGHIQNIVVRALPKDAAVFTYDPHYWFYIGRRETERALIKEVVASGKQFLMTVAGTTPLDALIRADFDTDDRQYHIKKSFDDAHLYLVVIGDFIFETRFDPSVSARIEDIYTRYTSLTPEAVHAFDAVQEIRARSRLRVSRNKTRAQKLRSRLSKNFFIRPSDSLGQVSMTTPEK